MFGSDALDVAVGVVFVFVLVSMICSAVREGLEAWMKTRATHLEAGIRELLQDPSGMTEVKQLFDHPLIFGLFNREYTGPRTVSWWPTALTRGKNLPSYIPSRNFALALMDLAARGPAQGAADAAAAPPPLSLATIRENVTKNIPSVPVQRALLTALDTAQGDFNTAVSNLEHWYDSAMDRVSGWYKRSTQWILFAIGVFAAVTLNINTLTIANRLYNDKAARETLVARASAPRDQPPVNQTYGEVRDELASLTLPIGWSAGLPLHTGGLSGIAPIDVKTVDWWATIGGWLITAFAATLGAPFWFDVLNKIMVIRSTVKPHEKSPEESSEDRQTGKGDKGAPPPAAPPDGKS
jgi:hypothetical protein